MRHIFTVDVEDWYHGFSPAVFGAHTSMHRLDQGMNILLDLLDEHRVRGTFFWLGTCARRYGELLKMVRARGHEIGCHGFEHQPIFAMTRKWFSRDIHDAISIIADLTGELVKAFRAPNFSIRKDTMWALEELVKLGIQYDSSVLPLHHWRTGIPNFGDDIRAITTPSGIIMEVPISTSSIAGIRIPTSGGGYFRSYPYFLTRSNIRYHESIGKPVVFYIHPWELDHNHPRLSGLSFSKSIHYVGLHSVYGKLEKLLHEFNFAPLIERVSEEEELLIDDGIKDIIHYATRA